MKPETMAIHSGYEIDPTTKAVAVPIYQTVAYAFDSADHAASLFNLDAEGFRYTRIQNPTTAVLERRVAALEGGIEAMCVSSGQAAVNYAVQNIAELGSNIVSVPQLYGTTHTLFAHILPSQGTQVRFAQSDRPDAIASLIDERTRAVFCESVGNPAGNICDIEGLARVAHQHGVPLIVDNTVASPILLRPIDFGADIVVESSGVSGGGGAHPYEVERTPPDQYQATDFPNFHYILFHLHGRELKATMYRLGYPMGDKPEWQARDSFVITAK